MSAAMMTPPLNLTPSTDVPVTMGFLPGGASKQSAPETGSDRGNHWLRLMPISYTVLFKTTFKPKLFGSEGRHQSEP